VTIAIGAGDGMTFAARYGRKALVDAAGQQLAGTGDTTGSTTGSTTGTDGATTGETVPPTTAPPVTAYAP
jgi:hypothetical protein